ncbi:Phosphatidylinositol 4-phosphate 5-kinase its3 [Grifola frondosa]|uniref:1-phosphatidylinositol-4-phosphate 5-kinase n=1 Tax=Grifola frondosa TaxID=5627 RepID=A0A1C7LS28_GRIFR|nr:Phosphatidylinositol 4-phosphate 5-kinase its3 [Grifola frondosa]
MAAAVNVVSRTSSPSPIIETDDALRQSYASPYASTSAASFFTAPLTSPLSLSSSSVHTQNPNTPREPEAVNSMHALAFSAGSRTPTQEVHIVKLTDDTLRLETAVPDSVLHKVGTSLAHPVPGYHTQDRSNSTDSNIGPHHPLLHPAWRTRSSRPRPASQASALCVRILIPPSHLRGAHRAHILQLSRPAYIAPGSIVSVDGYLQPPSTHKPSRRNTTGAVGSTSSRPVRTTTMHTVSHSFTVEEGGELAEDIEQQAEQIRRERMSKRAKAQQEAERALTRTVTSSTRAGDGPLVGNLIGEDHVNYVLMYNMLTGIRIAVSRCQAKIRRPLTDEDYTARHKYSFDIVGNELTPSAKYDFKFKDYAPWVFRELREDYFHLDPADYLLSLTAKYILSELGSPGKSGSFFYFSRDYRFIIKTIHHAEHKFLRSILKQYYEHVKSNPHTLLSRFYGLHRVKLPHGRKIHFVIMNNLFPAHKDIHETYDLKGSTVGREYPEEKAAQNPRAVLKDLNWINRRKTLELGPEKRALLTEQLRRDAELLKRLHVMDYSLLVGIHNMRRGNRDNVRSNTLKVFSPDMPLIRRKNTVGKGPSSPEAIAMRRIMRESDPKRLGSGTIDLPEEDTGERQHFLFYQDEGGLRATDETNDSMDTIYYLGVIDILTPYSILKKLEHCWKGLSADRHKISPVPPAEYSSRFFAFMKAIMRGGEGGGKFKSE